jgi:hypothetical protein
LANTCRFVGKGIIVQQEKISRAESSWTNPVNALQEAIHYACGTFGISVSSAEGSLTNPFRTLLLFFWVIGKTTGLISHNNFV